jgi:hypothetical protein
MAQIVINNGDSGLVVRNALNGMFAELYGAIALPIKIAGLTTNYTQPIAANTLVVSGAVRWISGSVTIKIGSTGGGSDIMPSMTLTSAGLVPLIIGQYFGSAANIYITLTGTGSVNVRFDQITNYN